MAEAADSLERELASAGLNPRAFSPGLEALRALGRGEDPGLPPPSAWPDWLAEQVRLEETGEAWIALRLRLPEGVWPQGPPPELLERLAAVAPGSALASVPALGAELRRVAGGDLRRLGGIALAAVVLVTLASFRGHLLHAALAALPVVLGTLWTLGLWGALGRSLDLLSLTVLPILLGIGVDDGLHTLHGARRDTAAGITGAAREAGRAMTLTTLTTCAGFGSLAFSHVPGLAAGGTLVATGTLACLAATLLVLPALDAVLTRRRSER